MTKEEKSILLKDLCARLPYGIFVKENRYSLDDGPVIYTYDYHPCIDNCKPYLRPMSSMTEEERKELRDKNIIIAVSTSGTVETTTNGFDWLNKKGFDYRGLIPMGLALGKILQNQEDVPQKNKGKRMINIETI